MDDSEVNEESKPIMDSSIFAVSFISPSNVFLIINDASHHLSAQRATHLCSRDFNDECTLSKHERKQRSVIYSYFVHISSVFECN